MAIFLKIRGSHSVWFFVGFRIFGFLWFESRSRFVDHGVVHSTGLMRLDARKDIMELTHGPNSFHLWATCWSDCLSDLGFSESPGLSPAFGVFTREITRLRVNRI